MSVRIMSAVIDHSRAEGSTYTVLLMLADHANSDGQCWPSMSRLAERSRVSLSTAHRAVAELEQLGELVRILGGRGRGDTNRYQVMPGAVDNRGVSNANLTSQGSHPATKRVSSCDKKGPTVGPEPSINQIQNPPKPPRPASVDILLKVTTAVTGRVTNRAGFEEAVLDRIAASDPNRLDVLTNSTGENARRLVCSILRDDGLNPHCRICHASDAQPILNPGKCTARGSTCPYFVPELAELAARQAHPSGPQRD